MQWASYKPCTCTRSGLRFSNMIPNSLCYHRQTASDVTTSWHTLHQCWHVVFVNIQQHLNLSTCNLHASSKLISVFGIWESLNNETCMSVWVQAVFRYVDHISIMSASDVMRWHILMVFSITRYWEMWKLSNVFQLYITVIIRCYYTCV